MRIFLPISSYPSADLVPVIVIALVSFLIKTGALSAIIIGIKRLREWFKNK